MGYKLRFVSTKAQSKYPISTEDNGLVKRWTETRKTTVVCEHTPPGRKNPKIYEAFVLCHPKETDNPVIGQKYAMQALVKQFPRKVRFVLWHEFATHSKAAANIMGYRVPGIMAENLDVVKN